MSDAAQAMPTVKMYKCDGCGGAHPYACQKIAAEQAAALRAALERARDTFADVEKAMQLLKRETVAEAMRIAREDTEHILAEPEGQR